MKLGGDADRIELAPETDADKAALEGVLARERVIRQVLNESHPFIYWGDSDEFGGALIINSHRVASTTPPVTVEIDPLAEKAGSPLATT